MSGSWTRRAERQFQDLRWTLICRAATGEPLLAIEQLQQAEQARDYAISLDHAAAFRLERKAA